jgi:hypothetical protein
MNHADVVGYAVDGEIFCPDCAGTPDDDMDVVFAGHEFDFQPCCDGCGCEIEVTVLQEEDQEDEDLAEDDFSDVVAADHDPLLDEDLMFDDDDLLEDVDFEDEDEE